MTMAASRVSDVSLSAAKLGQLHHEVVTEPRPCLRKRTQRLKHFDPLFKFHPMPLAIGKADGLDARIALQGPGEADRGILPAGKEHQGRVVQPYDQLSRPLKCLIEKASGSTPSRQRTLTATMSLPSGILPRANEVTPHVLQNR